MPKSSKLIETNFHAYNGSNNSSWCEAILSGTKNNCHDMSSDMYSCWFTQMMGRPFIDERLNELRTLAFEYIEISNYWERKMYGGMEKPYGSGYVVAERKIQDKIFQEFQKDVENLNYTNKEFRKEIINLKRTF